MTGRWVPWLLAGMVLALAGLSLWLGQDVNFDLLNYHYYIGYAFLHDGVNRDVVPAGIQTYLPPLLDVFHYLGIAHLPPRLFGLLLGALHGLNVPVLFVLGLAVLAEGAPGRETRTALLAALLGGIGPTAVSLLGTTFGDNLVSIPALLALALVLRQVGRSGPSPGLAPLLGAGVLAGLATGLKLTMGLYHVALFATVIVALWHQQSRWRGFGLFVLGSFLGFAPTGGFWCWRLFEWFGNPLFPWANALFRSEFFRPENFRATRWAAHTAYDFLRPAVDAALGHPVRLQEVGLRDCRLLLVLVAALISLARVGLGFIMRRGAGPRAAALRPPERALLVYWFTAYVLWVGAFYYYRYLVPLELTAPLVVFVLMRRFVPGRYWTRIALVVAIALALTTHVGSWGRRQWQESWLDLAVPAMGLQPDSLVLLVGQPISYAIPSFREDARFALLTLDEFGATPRWEQRVAGLIAGHRGPFLLLSTFAYSRGAAAARAADFGLRPTGRCAPAGRGPLRLRLCELQRE